MGSEHKRRRGFASDLKLRTKLLLVYVVVFVFIISLTILLVSVFLTRDVTEREMRDTVGQTARSANICSYLLGSVENTGLDLYNDPAVYDFLSGEYVYAEDAMAGYESVVSVLRRYSSYEYLKGLTIYSDNSTLIPGEYLAYSDENVRLQSWYRAMLSIDQEGSSYWGVIPYRVGDDWVVAYYKNLKDSLGGYKNIAVFEINIEEIGKQIRDDTRSYSVVNCNGYVVYSTEADIVGRYYSDIDPSFNPRLSEGQHYTDGANRAFVAYNSFYIGGNMENAWFTVVCEGEEFLTSMISRMIVAILILSVVAFLIIFLMLYFVIRSVTGRIQKLVDGTARIREGVYGEEIMVGGKDEIGILATDFNRMSQQLDSLFNETYVQRVRLQEFETAKAKAEFKTLQSQVDPHFLYNTLEIIRMHAVLSGSDEVAEMLVILSKLFRYNISRDVAVRLSEEVDYCRTYISMLNLRSVSEISFTVRLSKDVLECTILKTTLQPLVENCVKHGMKHARSINVLLEGRMEEGDVILTLSDDGAGIDEKVYDRVQRTLEKGGDEGNHVGMQNVNDRLRLYFGEKYGLKLIASEKGTTVEIRIRAGKGEKND